MLKTNVVWSRIRRAYVQSRRNALNRNLSWELSFEEFKEITSKNCTYCGASPQRRNFTDVRPSGRRINGISFESYNSIDRINNKIGYSLKNCAPCCFECNRMKSDLGLFDFLDKARRIFMRMGLK